MYLLYDSRGRKIKHVGCHTYLVIMRDVILAYYIKSPVKVLRNNICVNGNCIEQST